jgi:hypothetical protein
MSKVSSASWNPPRAVSTTAGFCSLESYSSAAMNAEAQLSPLFRGCWKTERHQGRPRPTFQWKRGRAGSAPYDGTSGGFRSPDFCSHRTPDQGWNISIERPCAAFERWFLS